MGRDGSFSSCSSQGEGCPPLVAGWSNLEETRQGRSGLPQRSHLRALEGVCAVSAAPLLLRTHTLAPPDHISCKLITCEIVF